MRYVLTFIAGAAAAVVGLATTAELHDRTVQRQLRENELAWLGKEASRFRAVPKPQRGDRSAPNYGEANER